VNSLLPNAATYTSPGSRSSRVPISSRYHIIGSSILVTSQGGTGKYGDLRACTISLVSYICSKESAFCCEDIVTKESLSSGSSVSTADLSDSQKPPWSNV
jgi:hypothetical protein